MEVGPVADLDVCRSHPPAGSGGDRTLVAQLAAPLNAAIRPGIRAVGALGRVRQQIVHFSPFQLYNSLMDVAVSDLRAHLSEWLERAREGEEVVVTDRGVPVARLLGINASATLERLVAEGVIGRPERTQRMTASGRSRPRPRHSVSARVSEQRR